MGKVNIKKIVLTTTIAIVGIVGTVSCGAKQDDGEAWEEEFREILLNNDRAVGFDLNDFEEDGIPELIILNKDDSLSVRYCREYENRTVYELNAVEQIYDEEIGFHYQYNYGYDMEYDRIVELTDWIHKSGQTATSFDYLHFSNGVMEREEPVSYAFNADQYPIRWDYSLNENGQKKDILEDEAMEYLAEARSRFNEIRFTDITEAEIEVRFDEFKRNGNRERKRNNTVTNPVQTEEGTTETVEIQELSLNETEVTLSDKEQEDLQTLASVLALNSYHFSENMHGYHYPVSDLAVDMATINILGSQGLTEDSYMKYLPPTEIEGYGTRYCGIDDVQFFLKNVFGIENVDISAYCEGDRAVFDMIGDFALTDSFIDDVTMMSDDTYRIEGKFVLWVATDIPEVVYPYGLTVIKNEASPFGFQVISMEYQDEVTGEFTDAALWVPDDPEKGPESKGHSVIYNSDGTETRGTEADQYYKSLKSGNEIPIIWCEVNPTNIEALITGGSVTAVHIPAPLGRYTSNKGSELEFYSDNTVRVTEGNIGHVYNYTIDSAGNFVINPENEAVEGTYNSATDIVTIYGMLFKKH